MPSDAEFERALRTRDCYSFKRGLYLLTTLGNSWHAKDPLDFSGGNFSIEHHTLQNSSASNVWSRNESCYLFRFVGRFS